MTKLKDRCFSWIPATMFVPLKANRGCYENYDQRPKTPKAKTSKTNAPINVNPRGGECGQGGEWKKNF